MARTVATRWVWIAWLVAGILLLHGPAVLGDPVGSADGAPSATVFAAPSGVGGEPLSPDGPAACPVCHYCASLPLPDPGAAVTLDLRLLPRCADSSPPDSGVGDVPSPIPIVVV
ncbi:hypothetical protein [Deferrisoma camini]|uniref:hypothetical protein n=1 Tax=Deferrisoma camini TaxID=1035120 RepID=UPI00046D258D|nr:hypothetical protein [Deferrisoma camini]